MCDRMTIVGSDKKARYAVEGEKVIDLRFCDCKDPVGNGATVPQCKTCGKTIKTDELTQRG